MRQYFISGFAAALLGYSPVHGSTTECDMDANFENSEEASYWRTVNDGVMGGRSSGGPDFKDGMMRFSGMINTNGGGFSSVRTTVAPGDLISADGLKIRVKSDGREYKVTLRTNATYRGRLVSFQAPIPMTEKNEWEDVFVPFDRLEASLFGRPLSGGKFERDAAQELGIIIADGRDGPFQLDIKWIKGCITP